MIYYPHMEDNNLDEKLRNLEEWNVEHAAIKPILEVAVDYHNKARREAYWKNYEKAFEFFKLAIENYKNALKFNPKYYLKDVIERVDSVIGEHIYNIFNLKASENRLKTEQGIRQFVEFIEGLSLEEKKYIDLYDIALNYFKIGEMYFDDNNFDKAYEFFNRALDLQCNRPFLNRDAYYKTGQILFSKKQFKEALIIFVSVLSFDRGDKDAISYIDGCLRELGIYEHRLKFLSAMPNDAKKLIMEVL
jgi:tetratricopeptide (TPR) repeat protein